MSALRLSWSRRFSRASSNLWHLSCTRLSFSSIASARFVRRPPRGRLLKGDRGWRRHPPAARSATRPRRRGRARQSGRRVVGDAGVIRGETDAREAAVTASTRQESGDGLDDGLRVGEKATKTARPTSTSATSRDVGSSTRQSTCQLTATNSPSARRWASPSALRRGTEA